MDGVCSAGLTEFYESVGIRRFRCEACDFDLCQTCHNTQVNTRLAGGEGASSTGQASTSAPPSEVDMIVSSDVSALQELQAQEQQPVLEELQALEQPALEEELSQEPSQPLVADSTSVCVHAALDDQAREEQVTAPEQRWTLDRPAPCEQAAAPEQRWRLDQPAVCEQAAAPHVDDVGGEFELFVQLPSIEVARFLASSELGISRRTCSKLMAGYGDTGVPILQIRGAPHSNAAACHLVQEALWLSGAFGGALC